MYRTLITTSHRPSRNTRIFVKFLNSLIPNSIRVSRGKATFSMLAVRAIDMSIDRVVIVRNRKGNPGYIDVYAVDHLNRALKRLCTMRMCGFRQDVPKFSKKSFYKSVVISIGETVDENTEAVLNCLLNIFPRAVYRERDVCSREEDVLFLDLRTVDKAVEVSFSDCAKLLGVVRLCP